ncbi:MAG: hypothetical protein H0V25_07365, partial [Solirubrobacterales bacterium]|nr:hypothetical protein [Solirubrobacterales bacterium]
FALFKEGIVRFDTPHLGAYFATMVVFWLAVPWGAARRLIPAVGAVALLAVAVPLQLHDDPGQAWDLLNGVDNVHRAYDQADLLVHPDERSQAAAEAAVIMAVGYGIDPRMLSELEGHSVAIDPWEIAVVWTYQLDWSPLPVFQNYSAYTAKLDQLNAERIASPEGPEMILRQNPAKGLSQYPTRTIDRRYPAWDPPAQALATLCNFAPLRTTKRWQLLERVPDRCAEPQPIGSVESSYGETVLVPQAPRGAVVFVRIHGAEVSGLESLRSLLYRAKPRYAVVDGGDRFRLIPGTAGDGLLLRGEPQLTGAGLLAQAPQAKSIELTGLAGDLRYDFYSMALDDQAAQSGGN